MRTTEPPPVAKARLPTDQCQNDVAKPLEK